MELGDLYERYNQPIGKYIFTYLQKNRCILPLAHSEEIKSSIFLKLTAYCENNIIIKPKTFLYKVSQNACLSHFRQPPCSKSKSQTKIVSLDEVTNYEFFVSPCCSDQQRLELKQILTILRQEISLLELKYKNAIMDSYMGIQHEEIAKKRQISIDTSKKNRQTALHLLRRALAKREIVFESIKKGVK